MRNSSRISSSLPSRRLCASSVQPEVSLFEKIDSEIDRAFSWIDDLPPAGDVVGYGRAKKLTRPPLTATIPVGYFMATIPVGYMLQQKSEPD